MQYPLFVEDYNAAIRQTVEALGGFKVVGAAMRPELPVDQAGRWLSDCVNPDRRDFLAPERLGFLRRMARREGVHILATFEARDASYADPEPVEPENEFADLQRTFSASVQAQGDLVRRMETLSKQMSARKR
jgi:hypothetical protein